VVANFLHSSCGTGDDGLLEEVHNVEYVGEILELGYRCHCTMVLICNWMKARYIGPNPIIKRDNFGFISANISKNLLMDFGLECFAFSIHVQQVFFSDDKQEVGWKVASKVEV
jgi:hypothetical protein